MMPFSCELVAIYIRKAAKHIKTRSPPTSPPFKDQATKHINIEYGLLNFAAQIIDQNCKKEKASTSFLPAFTCDTCIMQ